MTFILPSFGASAIAAVPGGGGGFSNDYSLSLDGTNQYASIDGVAFSGAFTVSMWFKLSSYSSSQSVPLFYKDYEATSTTDVTCNLTNNEARFYVYDRSQTWGQGYNGIKANFTPVVNTWYHIASVYTGSTASGAAKIFINGSELTGTPQYVSGFGGISSPSSTVAYLGYSELNTKYLNGKIDEVAIFGSELSATNISDIYNSGAPTDISSLSPKHWWRMGDSDSGVSNGSSTPTIVSNVGNSSAIQNHYALDFDGSDDFMATGSNFASTFGSAFTISCWFKRDSGSGTGAMFGQWHDSNFRHYIYVTGGSLIYDIRIAGTAVGAPTMSIAQDTNWHHVAVTVKQDSSNVLSSIYLDGVSGGTTTVAATLSNFVPATDWAVGKRNRPGGSEIPFAGLIDEVSIIGSALSDGGVSSGQTAGGDIATLYNNGVPADISSFSPVSWYRMGDNDSGTGTTITDQGSGSNDGTLTNGPTFSTNTPTANAILTNGPTYSDNVPT